MDKNNNHLKISIVTPNFNGAKYIEETILSILGQNYPNLEYIIIDGGSTDNSVEIIKKYESQLSHWVSEPDKGLYDAIQKGFDKSTGEIMAWLNSDDMYHKNSLIVVASIFENLIDVNWFMGIPSTIDEHGNTIAVSNLKKWSKLDYYSGHFEWIQQESTFWRRSLWEQANATLSTEMKYAGDLDLWLRFFRYEKLYVTRALLGGFRMQSANQLSLDFLDDYLKEARQKIKFEVENNIPQSEKIFVKKVAKIDAIIKSISNGAIQKIVKFLLYKLIYKKINSDFKAPPEIKFNRFTQNFYI